MSSPGLTIVFALVVGYLCGSIPFGLILTRLAGLGDIRSIGSGNIGATNVLRTGNRWLAFATLLCDGLKATIPILIVGHFFGESAALATGFGAFLGHVFPVWLRFKGGKGVATYIGVLLGLYWPAGIAFCLIWLVVAFLVRISSLAALSASAIVGLGTLLVTVLFETHGVAPSSAPDLQQGVGFVVLAIIIFITHRANLQRLAAGTEPRIGAGKKPA